MHNKYSGNRFELAIFSDDEPDFPLIAIRQDIFEAAQAYIAQGDDTVWFDVDTFVEDVVAQFLVEMGCYPKKGEA